MLWNEVNYSSDVSYLNNVFIYEYDISKANINVLYSKGAIDKDTYDYLYTANRDIRQVYIGKLQKENKEIVNILKAGIIEAKKCLFEANNIQDYEVLSIKNDAVFIINRQLQNTQFGLINFKCKNKYTSFYKFNNLEVYYFYDSFSKNEVIEVKGISDNKLALHKDYMLQLLKDIFYTIQTVNVEMAMRMLRDFYLQYIKLELPIEYYRKFSADSAFHYKLKTISGAGYDTVICPEGQLQVLDISYNISVLMDLQKILASMYFTKHQ